MTAVQSRGRPWMRLAFTVSIAVNLLVLYWPRAVSPGGVPYADKLAHITIFGAVALTGVLARVPLPWLVGLLALHAVSSELAQHWLLAHRSGDVTDALADLVGVALGVLAGRRTARTGVAAGRPGGSWSA